MPQWSEIFAYSTVKVVKIRDARLGILHYIFILVIIAYISIYSIAYEKHYLKTEAPIGSVRLNLMQSHHLTPSTQLNYCAQTNRTELNGFEIYPCVYWDEYLAVYPQIEEYSVFATSRVTISYQGLNNCSLTDSSCEYVEMTNDTTYYIANLEQFTLLIDHTMFAPNLNIQRNAESLPGYMVGPDGKVMPGLDGSNPNNTIGVAGQSDIVPLSTLLTAAGISSLDEVSQTNNTISTRNDGIILMVFITYSNTFSSNLDNIQYTYRVVQVKQTKFKALQTIISKNITERVIWNRHGIRMIFLQTGQLGAFDFQATLLTFVAGLGLLTVSTFLVDNVIMRILPRHHQYEEFKYQVTDNMFPHNHDHERAPIVQNRSTHSYDSLTNVAT